MSDAVRWAWRPQEGPQQALVVRLRVNSSRASGDDSIERSRDDRKLCVFWRRRKSANLDASSGVRGEIPAFPGRGVPPMCDYSLHHVANRPAKIEDKLVTTKFNNSITRGFAAVGQPNIAVCLLPGTEIAFDENVECESSFDIGILPNKKIGQRLARFPPVNMNKSLAHHHS